MAPVQRDSGDYILHAARNDTIVAFRSAKVAARSRYFRGAKGDNPYRVQDNSISAKW
jgi:hypothetical protein